MRKIVIVIFLLAAALLLGIYFYNPDSGIIDSGYITSKEYQALEKEIERNREASRDGGSILSEIAGKTLSFGDKKEIEYPFLIDSLFIETLIVPGNEIMPSSQNTVSTEFENSRFYSIPVTQKRKGLAIVFFLIQRPGMYRDIDLVVATMKNSIIVDIKSIGSFRKNLVEATTSIIHIYRDRIETKVEKLRFYPVEQKNIVHYSYSVSNDGTILIN